MQLCLQQLCLLGLPEARAFAVVGVPTFPWPGASVLISRASAQCRERCRPLRKKPAASVQVSQLSGQAAGSTDFLG